MSGTGKGLLAKERDFFPAAVKIFQPGWQYEVRRGCRRRLE